MTDRLVEEGFISFEQAELAEGTDGTQSPVRLRETLGYIGAIGVFIATIALMIDVTVDVDNLLLGGIDNIPGGLVTVVGALIAGYAGYRFTGSDEGAVRRSGGFVLASAFGLWTIAVQLLLQDLDIDDFTPLVLVIPVAIAAWYIWDRFESVPTQLVVFAALVQVVNALLILVQIVDYRPPAEALLTSAITGSTPETPWFATLVLVAVGVAWVWATNEGFLRPRNTGFAIGALFAGFNGISLFATADGWIVLFAAITLAVLYGGLTWRSSVLLAIGAGGIIVFIIMLMTIMLDEVTTMQVTLWFGIPGLAALGYAAWSENQAGGAATPAAPMTPEPPASTPPPTFPPSEEE